jgi:hypothetical protein
MTKTRRRTAGVIGVTVAASALVGCTEAATPTPSFGATAAFAGATASDLTKTTQRLAALLTCTEQYDLLSDPSFFDPARGVDCIRSDRSAVFVRVYSHAETVPRVLQEWGQTFGEGRKWIRGKNWIVMGPTSALSDFEFVDGASRPTATPPTGVQTPVDAARRDTCMSLLSSAAADRVVGADDAAATLEHLDEEYAGAARAVNRAVTPALAVHLRAKPDYVVSSALTRFGDSFRDVCRSALGD